MPVLGHLQDHVPVRHVPGHMLEHVPKHVPDRHVLDRHVPEHVFARHVLGHVLGLHFFPEKKSLSRIFFNTKTFFFFFRTQCAIQ